MYFTAKIVNIHITSLGLTYGEHLWWSFFAKITRIALDARLGSKYASSISYTVEKVYRISIFI